MPIKKVNREDAIASNVKKEEERQKNIEINKNTPKIKIPKDTYLWIKNQPIDNFSLKLYRFAKFDEDQGFKIDKQNISPTFFNKNWDYYESYIKAYYKRIQNLNLKFSNPIELKTDYRLVIGSEQSIYETSIKLHHIYGIPYIPASGIKGVVRSYIITEKFRNSEDEALSDDNFVQVFGSQESEGKVTFFDAFPTSKPTIKVDIMTPHYGDYYKDKNNKKKIAPTDTQSPNPIPFLTVENTTFKFFIASKEALESFKVKDKTFIDWFKEALQNHGLGAKTAVGYGYFD